MRTVAWTEMQYGTKQDYEFLMPAYEAHAKQALVDNLCGLLDLLKGPTLGYRIDRYQHSLQSATRACRNDEPVEFVVGALLHDIGDGFAPDNHSAAAAAVLAPYVGEEVRWVVEHHGLFQGYYYFHHVGGDREARDRYRGSPYYERCADFCANYDQNCFDPSYANMELQEFRPMLESVFSRPSYIPGAPPPDARAPRGQ